MPAPWLIPRRPPGPAPSRETVIMRIHFILSACLLALLLFLMNSTVQRQTGLSNTGIPATKTYDYRMNDLDYTQYDAQGLPDYRLVADSITHYPEPRYDLIVSPKFDIYRDEETTWTITALDGRSEQDAVREEQRVDLKNSVVIKGVDARGRELEIYTDTLSVYPESGNVATSSRVRIKSENSEITGNGMTANLDTSRIQLLSNVRGQYEPQAD